MLRTSIPASHDALSDLWIELPAKCQPTIHWILRRVLSVCLSLLLLAKTEKSSHTQWSQNTKLGDFYFILKVPLNQNVRRNSIKNRSIFKISCVSTIFVKYRWTCTLSSSLAKYVYSNSLRNSKFLKWSRRVCNSFTWNNVIYYIT